MGLDYFARNSPDAESWPDLAPRVAEALNVQSWPDFAPHVAEGLRAWTRVYAGELQVVIGTGHPGPNGEWGENAILGHTHGALWLTVHGIEGGSDPLARTVEKALAKVGVDVVFEEDE